MPIREQDLPRHHRPDAFKSDPASEYYVPNDWANRVPSAAQDDEDPRRPHYGSRYQFDVEAIVFQSQLNPNPRRDPLEAALELAQQMAWPRFDRDHTCRPCGDFDRGMRSPRALARPLGTNDVDSCDGCLISHLDSRETMGDKRDRLYGEWASCRAILEEANLERPQTPVEKKRHEVRRKAATRACATARQACLMVGFDPAKTTRRRRVSLAGEPPRAALQSPIETRDFPGGGSRR